MRARGNVKYPPELVLRYDALRTIKTIVNHSSADRQDIIGKEDPSVVEEIRLKTEMFEATWDRKKQDTLS